LLAVVTKKRLPKPLLQQLAAQATLAIDPDTAVILVIERSVEELWDDVRVP
jgi:hypothetical protein